MNVMSFGGGRLGSILLGDSTNLRGGWIVVPASNSAAAATTWRHLQVRLHIVDGSFAFASGSTT